MLIIRLLINALALILVSYVVPGFHVDSFFAALIAAVLLGVANILVRPILILLTLPVTILTLGLFIFVINALMILLVSNVVKGFTVDSFSAAFWGAIVLWLISLTTNWLGHEHPQSH